MPLITESFRHPIEAFTDVGQRPAIVMPLRAQQSVLGILAVARNDRQTPFDASHLELMADFADHAVVALKLSESREQARDLSLITDRERIAHDLHDHVIQRLFAAGMDLQGTIARSRSPEVTMRLNRTVDDLQATVEEIRSRIFALHSVGQETGFRQAVQNAVATLTDGRDIETTVRMSGPLSAVSDELAEQATPGRHRSGQQCPKAFWRAASHHRDQRRRRADHRRHRRWPRHRRRQCTAQRPGEYAAPRRTGRW